MKTRKAAHRTHPWVINEVAPDFSLLDVWHSLSTGGRRTSPTSST